MPCAKFINNFLFVTILAFTLACTASPSNISFEILYFGNLNGNIENCKCGDPPLGGLDRIATLIDTYRQKYPEIVVIDGGDTFNSYPFKELNLAIVNSYKIIKPDIWVIAEQEFFEGAWFLSSALSGSSIKILTGNYVHPEIKSQEKIILESHLHKKIAIYSYVSPLVFSDSLKGELVIDAGFLSSLKIDSKSYFNILIFHGSHYQLKNQKKYIKNFDLVLTAHQQGSDIDINSKPAIIGASADGENIMHISLQKTAGTINITAKRIPVEIDIKQNKQIWKYISTYRANIKN